MFIKRNKSKVGTKQYESVLLVRGERVPVAKAGAGRPRKDSPRATKVVHRTLANLSKLPGELVELIERWCRGGGGGGQPEVSLGACYGVLGALHALAGEIGLCKVLGGGRMASLALFLVYARLAMQGSRLGAVRWAEDHAVAEVLGLRRFDEDELYAALDWLDQNQPRIEAGLAAGRVKPGAVFLYDVTSSYFEGQCNELAAPGHNRDGKKHKKQLVAGLLTDPTGEPLSVELFKGNTADPATFGACVAKVRARFGAADMEVVFVGDRGMIKSRGKEQLSAEGFRYITALTDPQIRKLLADKVVEMDLFDEQPAEVEHAGRRLVLRCNPASRRRDRQRREDQWRKVRGKIEERNRLAADNPRLRPAASLEMARRQLAVYRLQRFVTVELAGRQVLWSIDGQAKAAVEQLDGCYVIETDLPAAAAGTTAVHDRYMDLTRVERDFRTMKTGALELRPIFLQKAGRTRGHALVTMLALKLYRALDARVAPLGLTVEDAIARLGGVRLVSLAGPGTGLWRLPDSYAAAQREVLDVLPKLPAPLLLSPKKRPSRRLTNPRNGRPSK